MLKSNEKKSRRSSEHHIDLQSVSLQFTSLLSCDFIHSSVHFTFHVPRATATKIQKIKLCHETRNHKAQQIESNFHRMYDVFHGIFQACKVIARFFSVHCCYLCIVFFRVLFANSILAFNSSIEIEIEIHGQFLWTSKWFQIFICRFFNAFFFLYIKMVHEWLKLNNCWVNNSI